MKIKRTMMGAAILAGGMAFVGSANAAQLLTNGGFETASPAGWGDGPAAGNDVGFGQYSHATQVYYSGPAPTGASASYGWQWGAGNGSGLLGSATQIVDVSGLAGQAYTFEAWLASWTGDDDYAVLTLQFFDGGGGQVGSTDTFDGNLLINFVQTAGGEAADQDNWKLYQTNGLIPVGAVSSVVMISSATTSANGNDAYVDLVSLDVVPEPASLALFGLGGLAMLRRKRA